MVPVVSDSSERFPTIWYSLIITGKNSIIQISKVEAPGPPAVVVQSRPCIVPASQTIHLCGQSFSKSSKACQEPRQHLTNVELASFNAITNW